MRIPNLNPFFKYFENFIVRKRSKCWS